MCEMFSLKPRVNNPCFFLGGGFPGTTLPMSIMFLDFPQGQPGKNEIAASMDLICAAKRAIVMASGAPQKDALRQALSKVHGPYDCPAALVKARMSGIVSIGRIGKVRMCI